MNIEAISAAPISLPSSNANDAPAVNRNVPQNVSAAPPAAPAQAPSPNGEALKAAVDQLQSIVKSQGRAIEFQIDKASGETVITVRNTDSGEVIRQIPNEEALRLAQQLAEHHNAILNVRA